MCSTRHFGSEDLQVTTTLGGGIPLKSAGKILLNLAPEAPDGRERLHELMVSSE